jgi:hypothetical protein
MIRLDTGTGGVAVNDHEFQIQLTHNEFIHRYPNLVPTRQWPDIGGIQWTIYSLPDVWLGDQPSIFGLTYLNQYITGIGFSPVFPTEFDPNNDDDQARWRQTQLQWIFSARSLLRSAYGEPNSVSLANVFDETEYPLEFRKELQCWGYTFRWGGAGLSYDDQDCSHNLYICYDTFKQISDWDALREECRRRILVERDRVGPVPYRYTENLKATAATIDKICLHFDFQSVRPMLYFQGLVFDLSRLKTKVILAVRPECENDNAKYRIERHDTVRKVYTSDIEELFDTLRIYIESPKP